MTEPTILAHEYAPPARPAWLLTFADLISLLLTFFVMLFAMSGVEIAKWREVNAALANRPIADARDDANVAGNTRNLAAAPERYAADLDYLAVVLGEKMASDPVLKRATLSRLEDRLVISFPADLLFASGQADLHGRAVEALYILGGVLRNLGNRVDIAGHADPVPIQGGAYPSNWELSIARAVAVAGELRRTGYRREMGVLGYGDTRYAEVTPSLPELERRQLARRVDIVIRPTRAERQRSG
ncbi:MAG: flagellar motor protein MotB [Rhodospirillales bacterium]|nr:flagellar motor protein MotB [Rhodospirillales bacterium]